MKVGFVAILGRPNVGKSTLINALLSKRVSIVTPRAQTTRDDISGILNEKDKQIVFVDTPGLFSGSVGLDKYMNKAAKTAAADVNAILYLIDCSDPDHDSDYPIIASLKGKAPIYLVINKIDLCRLEDVTPLQETLKAKFPEYPQIEAALINNFGIKEIKDAIEPTLNDGEPFYPVGVLTDKDLSYQAREIIREKLLHFLKQEVPHQAAVRIDSLKKEDGGYKIEATVLVEKENHKAIVIGKNGTMIKKISMAARHDMEQNWHQHVTNLHLDVEYAPNWRNDPKILKDLGYAGD